VNWVYHACDRDQCRTFVSLVMIPQIPLNAGNLGINDILMG
jgi:hypothetical protein